MWPGNASDVLSGGGDLGARMRAIDWSTTPLGAVERWPQSLRTCVRIILTSRQPMFVWWGDELINLYNDAYVSILGGKHPWALGRPAAEVWREIWSDVGPRATRAIGDNQGTFDEALLLIMDRNGYREETYYTFSYSPVPGDRGGPGGIICANSSDTQRMFGERQQALLREVSVRTLDARTVDEACQRANGALESNPRDLPFALLYLAQGGGVARLASVAGIARDHRLAQPVIDAANPGAWPVLDVLESGAPAVRSLERPGDLPCGAWDEPPSQAVGVPIRGADRALAGVLVVGKNPFRLLDDDYRRFLELVAGQIGNAIASAQAYDAERQRAEALAELDRAKTTFFSNISHELRTPLTLMIGPTEDALRSESRALAGESLDAVHRNELRLLKLVNALLDFSRIEAGRLRVHDEPTELGPLTRELASSFRSAMERAGLAFEVACDDFAEPVRVDRSMWEKIVLNLLSNALKFTFDGGVTLGLVDTGSAAELVVADTGTGIASHELPRLFERFHRVEGARSRTHEGSGIGLALTSELVKLHRGTIDVVSELGRGTRFTVRIPRTATALAAIADPSADTAESPAPYTSSPGIRAFVDETMRWLPGDHGAPDAGPAATATADTGASTGPAALAADGVRGARILVADDNADMRDYLRRLLGSRWEVIVAPDGARALEAARQLRPDLVLTDVMMPNLDGFGLLAALRADPELATVPVVVLSARAGEEARIEGIQAGADDYLIKPFSARELLARVGNLLQLAALRREVELERNRLTAYVRQTPAAVAVWEGPELRCSMHNDAHAELFRRSVARGARLVDSLPEVAASAMSCFERVMAEGASFDIAEAPLILTGDDGAAHDGYYNTAYRPLRDPGGEVTGVIAITVDVTDQVAARQAIESSRAAAESANRAKDEFLAMLGHELRNPLAPIITALELMRLRGGGGLDRERAVIERQTQHLAGLVDDLLDVSRITRGMITLRREHHALGDLIAKAIETSAPLFEHQRHELVTDVPRGIVVDADAARLTQVFANILTNAAKYTDPGGRVAIAARLDGDEVSVTFSDTGRGISVDMLPRVFDLFVQERQNLDRSRGGLGLGLSIVRSLAQLHGGRVEVTSPGPGRGSTFTVRLPRVQRTTEPVAVPAADAAIGHDGGVSVLVVDDNIDAAVLLADLLAAHGYITRVAHDAPQALALAGDFVPDVALLDIGLPAMDGYELARRLRALPSWRNVRLLALTGYGQRSDRSQSLQAGFDHHLVKPIDIATLQRLLPTVPRS